MKVHYIYLHCKPDGVPFYVGKGSGGRALSFKRRNRHYTAIVKKYGSENLKSYVFDCESEQDAFDSEIHVIAQLKAEGYKLANVTNGGEGTSGLKKIISQEQKKLLSEKSKGNKSALGYKHTQEALRKISDAMKKRPVNLKIIQMLLAGNRKKVLCVESGEIYESATKAAEMLGIKDKSSVTKACRGLTKTCYGITFSYCS